MMTFKESSAAMHLDIADHGIRKAMGDGVTAAALHNRVALYERIYRQVGKESEEEKTILPANSGGQRAFEMFMVVMVHRYTKLGGSVGTLRTILDLEEATQNL